MKQKFIKYDDHSFNAEEVLSYGSLEKFMTASQEKGHLVGWFEKDPNRDKKLKEVWKLANDANKDETVKEVKDEVAAEVKDEVAAEVKPKK